MTTDFKIVEEPLTRLDDYASVPIRFEVSSLYEIDGDNAENAELMEQSVEQPWIKDYDIAKGQNPADWPRRWDISNWGILAAYADGQRVGGSVLAYDTMYYWMIVSWDDEGASADGPEWSFTTEEEPANHPPDVPILRGRRFGAVNQFMPFLSKTQDPDGDMVYYQFNWGDGNFTPWLGPLPSGEILGILNKWTQPGVYGVRVRAKDEHGAISGPSTPRVVIII